jgi:GNAT superfamily N-acetyltransferase
VNWRIESIAAHPDVVDTLAAWHHAQWGALMAPWSLDDARRELREHVEASAGYPITLVALGGDDRIRGVGVGAALVRAIVEHAHRLGFATLYLFTPGSPQIYLRCGWREQATLRLGDRDVVLMVHGPAGDS